MADPQPYFAQAWHPATFAERGVSAPFTSPQLLGARLRQGKRGGIEVVIPNPSGGRGAYVLDWNGVRQLLRPTMHDSAMHQRVLQAGEVSPAMVRAAARSVARDGLAGRAAREAAAAADDADEDDRMLANFLLMMSLLEQSEPSGLAISETMPRTPELEGKAHMVAAHAGFGVDNDPKRISEAVEALAVRFAPIGVDPNGCRPRLVRLVARIDALRNDLAEQPASAWHGQYPGLAPFAAAAAARFAADARQLMRDCREMTADMIRLVQRWATQPDHISGILMRPDWLLDGWDQICLLWETATSPALRCAALPDIRRMIPHLPAEAASWLPGRPLQDDAPPAPPGMLRTDPSPPAGALLALTARSEQMRGLVI